MRAGVGLLVVASACAGVLFAAACSSFGASDSPSTTDAAADAATADAATADATADAAVDAAPPGAFLVETFETDNSACGGTWKGSSTISVDRIADAGTDGSVACRICTTVPPNSFFSLERALAAASGPPVGYAMEANMRIESGNAEVSAAFVVDGQFDQGGTSTGPGWHHVSHVVTPDAGAPMGALASGRVLTSPACVVVDDIVLRKVN
jgi:pyruvate/2-oxoglutarate dehydrogenase complex dihydrolipoamide acyltransferase (E2) component